MRGPTLVDAGPLVAFLARRDEHHEWAIAQFRLLPPPFRTCEAVLAEASFLLRGVADGPTKLLQLLEQGAVAVAFQLQEEVRAVKALMRRYENVPMSLADACLVRMAELHARATVFTVDGDFRVYRKNGRQVIPTLMPAGR